jgi:hypothetical protein
VRDAKIYGPRIVEIARTLPGRKGVTMGANHIESIERILGGSTIELSWKTYVEGLDEDTRRGMRIVEEIAKLQ